MSAEQPLVAAAVLRPFLPADAHACASIFRAAVEMSADEDYDEDQRRAWAATADDVTAFGFRLASGLTLMATIGDEPAGFASLKGGDVVDMLYVDPEFARRGIGSLLLDALTKLANGRGARQLTSDVSDTARVIFERAGFVAERRNMVQLDGVWLGDTTMKKPLATADSVGRSTSKPH